MALNFPAAPALNQVYTVNGESWQWDGHCWQPAADVETYAPVYIGTMPPASPLNGDLWWNSSTGKMCVYYTDPDSSQWVNVNQPPKVIAEVSADQVVEALLTTLPEHADIATAAGAGVPVGGLFKVTGATDVTGIRAVASYP